MADGSVLKGRFWLLTDPARGGGVVPIEEMLDGPREFLAFGLERGESVLVSRDAIRTVMIPTPSPGIWDTVDAGASLDLVTLTLDSGEAVSGVLRSIMPRGMGRMSDFFNAPGRFISIGLGDRIILVNKGRIVRVSF